VNTDSAATSGRLRIIELRQIALRWSQYCLRRNSMIVSRNGSARGRPLAESASAATLTLFRALRVTARACPSRSPLRRVAIKLRVAMVRYFRRLRVAQFNHHSVARKATERGHPD